ncbi:MAG: hypothetical protein MRJ92_07405 [Nitrospira sp.]|nr:hypothetical protein [Nitrospira sp.]
MRFGITFQGIVLFRQAHFHQLHLADHFGGRQSVSFDPLGQLTAKLSSSNAHGEVQAKLGLLIKQGGSDSQYERCLPRRQLCVCRPRGAGVVRPSDASTGADVAGRELRRMRAEELLEEVP